MDSGEGGMGASGAIPEPASSGSSCSTTACGLSRSDAPRSGERARLLSGRWIVRNFVAVVEQDGGEGGIRTRETLLTSTRFPVALLRPLGHLSARDEI